MAISFPTPGSCCANGGPTRRTDAERDRHRRAVNHFLRAPFFAARFLAGAFFAAFLVAFLVAFFRAGDFFFATLRAAPAVSAALLCAMSARCARSWVWMSLN